MNKKKKKRESVRKKLLQFLAVVLLSVVITILLITFLVNPIIKKTGESKISESTTYAVNLGVMSAIEGTVTYDDLIHIVTDASGKITMLQANSIQINALSRKVIDKTYGFIMEKISEPLKIPIGSFSGIPIFAGFGPEVVVKTVPYGSVKCNFLSEFVSAGINQTVHKIYLCVKTDISLVLPISSIEVKEETEVLISESLIIGEIPDTYLMAQERADLLNMVG